jgi:hypothetical protein
MIKYGILMACNRLILLNPTEFCDYSEKYQVVNHE